MLTHERAVGAFYGLSDIFQFTKIVFSVLSGECLRCMFWNNLGCIHFAMGKHNLGIFYFKKALQENDNACAQLGTGSSDPGRTFKR